MRIMRKFHPCGRCGDVHINMERVSGSYICICHGCGKKSPPAPTMREAYRTWQERIQRWKSLHV